MEIKEYEEKYAKGMSEIILSNLYTITIKDHGKEVVDRIARHFTEEEIKRLLFILFSILEAVIIPALE